MAEKINAFCGICGRGYHMCLSCDEMAKLNPWKRYTDTSEHYKVFQVLHGVSIGVYEKADAKAKLQMIDLSDMQDFKPNIRNMIEEILKEEPQLEYRADSIGDAVKEMNVHNAEAEAEAEAEKPKYIRKKRQSDVVEEE